MSGRYIKGPLTPDDPRHGTVNGYCNLRCRCDRCKQANTIEHRAYMHRHPEQIGKQRIRGREERGVFGTDPNVSLRKEKAVARAESNARIIGAVSVLAASGVHPTYASIGNVAGVSGELVRQRFGSVAAVLREAGYRLALVPIPEPQERAS